MTRKQFRQVVAPVLGICGCLKSLIRLMSWLSHILLTPYRLYREHKCRVEIANLPRAVLVDPNSPEYLNILNEIAVAVHQVPPGLAHLRIMKNNIAHLELSTSAHPDSSPIGSQAPVSLSPAWAVWMYLKQSGLAEQGSPESIELIHRIDSLYAKSQMHEESPDASSDDSDACLERKGLWRVEHQQSPKQGQAKQESQHPNRSCQEASQSEDNVAQELGDVKPKTNGTPPTKYDTLSNWGWRG